MATPTLTVASIVLECPDARILGDFYHRLLGWPIVEDSPGWVRIKPSAEHPGMSFATEPGYQAPTWPAEPGEQQMMMHLDIRVDDLDVAGAHAEAAGARPASYQPQSGVRVYLDPAGHPFCLFLPGW